MKIESWIVKKWFIRILGYLRWSDLKGDIENDRVFDNKYKVDYGKVVGRVINSISNLINSRVEVKYKNDLIKKGFKIDYFTELSLVLDNAKIGIIDLLIFIDNEIYIIDYKTDKKVVKDFYEIDIRYRLQMSKYIKRVREIYPDRKVEGYFLWINSMKLIKVLFW